MSILLGFPAFPLSADIPSARPSVFSALTIKPLAVVIDNVSATLFSIAFIFNFVFVLFLLLEVNTS